MALPFTRVGRAERAARVARAEFEAERVRRYRDAIAPLAASASFATARRTRVRPGPRPPGGSGQAHRDRVTRDDLRRDCQDAYRNNPIAKAIIDRKVELVVGQGPTLRVESEDPDFNDAAEALFAEWASECDITGRVSLPALLEQAVASCHTDGRIAFLKAPGPRGEGVLQPIEDELLRNPNGRPDDERFVAGVERAENGRPTRYHIARWQRDGSYASVETTPYDAGFVLAMGNPQCRVPGVIAPEPVLAPVLGLLELIFDAIESTTIAYRVATLFGFIQHSEDPAAEMAALRSGLGATNTYDSTADSGDPSEYALQPGIGWHLPTGGSVTQLKPEHPTTGIDKFLWAMVQLVAAECGLAVDQTHFIMDRNWSGTRSRLAMTWQSGIAWRRSVTELCRRVSRWKVAEWIRDGRLWAAPGWQRHLWVPSPMPMLDPAQEYKTRSLAIENRLSDYQQAFSETGGGDWRRMAERLASEVAFLREHGIDPVVRGATGMEAGARAGDETETGKPEEVGA